MKPQHIAYFVFFAGICVALHITKISPALPVLVREFSLTSTQAGFLLSLIQLAGMFLGLIIGALVEPIGHRNSILAGLSILLATTVAGVFADSASFLLVLRAFEGLGFLLAAMPAPAMIRQLVTSSDLPRMMALWSTYMPFGAAVSLFVGTIIIAFLNWQAWWLLLAGCTFVLLVCLYRVLPIYRAVQDNEANKAGQDFSLKALAAVHIFTSRLSITLKSPGPWLVATGFCMYSAQWLTVVGFLPTIFAQLGITGITVGIGAALIAGVNVVGNLYSGRLIGRGVFPPLIIYVGFIVMGVCAVIAFSTLSASTLWVVWLRFMAIFVFSAVGGAIPGTFFYLAVKMAPSQQTISTTVGWTQQLSSTGQFAAPPIVGMLVDYHQGDWQWTWVLLVICCSAGLVIAKLISHFLRRTSSVVSECKEAT